MSTSRHLFFVSFKFTNFIYTQLFSAESPGVLWFSLVEVFFCFFVLGNYCTFSTILMPCNWFLFLFFLNVTLYLFVYQYAGTVICTENLSQLISFRHVVPDMWMTVDSTRTWICSIKFEYLNTVKISQKITCSLLQRGLPVKLASAEDDSSGGW